MEKIPLTTGLAQGITEIAVGERDQGSVVIISDHSQT